MTTAIEVENIVKRYGSFEAVKDVSFTVAEGEIFGLLGPNGAGKSTLIRMMTTLIPITSGKAIIAGHEVAREPNPVRNLIGVIPQALTSDPDLTVEENLSIYAKLYNVPRAERERSITEVLEAVDLIKCRGLVHNPSIFFLDEPTTGLDPVSRIAVWEMLDNLRKTRHLTMLLTTHYMEEADKLCDRIAIVDHGTLVALGTPLELKHDVPGANVVEIRFAHEAAEWKARLEALEGVTSAQAESAGFYRVLTSSGSRTTMQLVELAAKLDEDITSLSVQNTTLDDVFVHYTGRQLRDEQVKPPAFTMPPRPGARP
jgi:ABC-2 type transport system ATP-binding protein